MKSMMTVKKYRFEGITDSHHWDDIEAENEEEAKKIIYEKIRKDPEIIHVIVWEMDEI